LSEKKDSIELFRKIDKLNEVEKEVLKYFISNVSVGDIRAILDLKAKGIEDPEKVILKLIREGLLERGDGCYNLPKKLRPILKKLHI
jgi:hypothetical protein